MGEGQERYEKEGKVMGGGYKKLSREKHRKKCVSEVERFKWTI